uniref:Uncharacterized protein LOC100182510 n=1 Tax=Phallusia mammillata TaxID=59560 RepID=A0A6F9DIC9_9ASCI|nr:uncharacterized protein LOC100182510 [Phallusia mammillata]
MNFLFRKKSQPTELSSPDEEVDGFVFIGETKDEKSTVNPGDLANKETPPSYNEIKEENADQTQTYQGGNFNPSGSASISQPSFSIPNHTDHKDVVSHSKQTDNLNCVRDVPFQFASSIETALRHETLMESVSLPELWCDTNVEYSFDIEYSVLQY